MLWSDLQAASNIFIYEKLRLTARVAKSSSFISTDLYMKLCTPGWRPTLQCGTRGRGGWLQGVEFWAVNTDQQALENALAKNKLQLGTELTRGLGAAPAAAT